MIDKLIVLADELDKLGEKEAADIVDKLVKSAAGEAEELEDFIEEADAPTKLQPLAPEGDESDFEDEEPTKVDFFSRTGPQLVARLRKFFMDNPEPAKWTPDERAKAVEAMQLLIG